MSTAILLTALFLYLVLPSFIPINLPLPLVGRESSEAKDESYKSREHFKVSGIQDSVRDIGWRDNTTILISTESAIYTFNTISRDLIKIYNSNTAHENHIISSDITSNIGWCTWENYVKQSPEDLGTKVTEYKYLSGKIESEIEVSLKETVKIEICNKNTILLSEAYPFMQEQRYTLSLPEKKLSNGWSNQLGRDSGIGHKWDKQFPINREMISLYKVSPDGIGMAYINQLGSLWIYSTNE